MISHFDAYPPGESRWKTIFSIALTRPFLLFAQEPIIQILGIYMAFLYGLFYRLSSFPPFSFLALLFTYYSGFPFPLSLPDYHTKRICQRLQRSTRHRRLTLLCAWYWVIDSVSTQCSIPGSYLYIL